MASPAIPKPAPITSYRYWERFDEDTLRAVSHKVEAVLDDRSRQYGLFVVPDPESPKEAAPAAAPAPAAPALTSDVAHILSPSQVKNIMDCPARWWFHYGLKLPDPKSSFLCLGTAVHKVSEMYFRARLAGSWPEPDDLAPVYEDAWECAADETQFRADEDIEELKRQGAILARKFLEDVAPAVEPAAVETRVEGVIAGVKVQGWIDLLDTSGRIIDLKTAKAKPSGVDPGYAFQLATYRRICPQASGEAEVVTMVRTKTPQTIRTAYTVTDEDTQACEVLYPRAQALMQQGGPFLPNRGSNLCSKRNCNFASACIAEYGGRVDD